MNTVGWIAIDQIKNTVRLEPVLVLVTIAALTWIAYKIFLRQASKERHRIFRTNFRNLSVHMCIGLVVYGLFEFFEWLSLFESWASILIPYVGFVTVIMGCVVLIKILRIVAYEFLFLMSMRAGVPLLIVNIFTLLFSLIMIGWVLTTFFQVKLTPLLATSAILSIVLGLALQDTLGNLFAGIALQIDKPFELGDWIEVKGSPDKIVGQVQEISWRATLLLAITDELITIPNRNMAQWQVSNYSGRTRPFVRSHIFRLPYGCSIPKAKQILVATAEAIPGVLSDPAPVVILTETTESWIAAKAIYSISDYGTQFGIADRFLTNAIENLEAAGIRLAATRLTLEPNTSRRP